MGNVKWTDTKTYRVRERLRQGDRPTDIAEALQCSLALVAREKKYLTEIGELKGEKATRGLRSKAEQIQLDLSHLEESTDLDWLRAVRNNSQVLWGDRIRAAIAASKLEESKSEDAWTPPTGEPWQALLRDLIASQSPEDRESILGALLESHQPALGDQA